MDLTSKGAHENGVTRWRGAWLHSGNAFLFWVNLGFAAAYVYVGGLLHGLSTGKLGSEPGYIYYLARASVRTYDVFHPAWWAPEEPRGNAVSNIWMWSWSEGLAIVTLACLFSLAAILMLLSLRTHGRWFRCIAWSTALFAYPVAYIFRRGYFKTWGQGFADVSNDVSAFVIPIFLANVLAVVLLAWWARRRPFNVWVIVGLMMVHYGFWIFAMEAGFRRYPGWFFWLECGVPLIAGIVAWFAMGAAKNEEGKRPGRWTLVGAVLGTLAPAFLWMPSSGEKLGTVEPGTRIEVLFQGYSRGQTYRLVIDGNGQLEYEGQRYVGQQGRHTKTLTPEQVNEILARLDAAEFTALEPRAFAWSFHASRVGVEVVQAGRSKRVFSDLRWNRTGPQGRFLQAVDEIPRIAGIGEWIRCDEKCKNKIYR